MFNLQTQAELITACCNAVRKPAPFTELRTILQYLFTLPNQQLEEILHTESKQAVSSIYISTEVSVRKIIMPPYYHGHIHDHNIWTVGGIFKGIEENVYYQEDSQGLAETKTERTTAGNCFMMEKHIIHAVRNSSDQTTLSLHIYGGDLMQEQKYIWHPLTFTKLPYDYAKACEFAELMTARLKNT